MSDAPQGPIDPRDIPPAPAWQTPPAPASEGPVPSDPSTLPPVGAQRYGPLRRSDGREGITVWFVVMGVGIVVALIVFAALALTTRVTTDRSGPCVGGPQIGTSATDRDGDGWFEGPCAISGTYRVYFGDTPSPTP